MSRTLRRTDRALSAAVLATYAAFIFTGLAFASWASRIPQVRDRLELSPAELGLVLLAIAAGSLVALPLAGAIVGRHGSKRTVIAMALVSGASLAVVAVGYQFGVVPVVVGLVGFGFGQGGWDVAMNVQGAVVEQRLGRAIMSRFHAGFSVGTVAGSLVGTLMVALSVPVTVHLVIVAVLVAGFVPLAVRSFMPDSDGARAEVTPGGAGRRALTAWREPRTLLIGVFVLTFAFAEGTGNDWTSIAFIDGYQTSPAVGTLGFATFLSAMTVGRFFGPGLLDRYGRVRVLRVLAAVSVVGVALFVLGGSTAVGFAGVVLWGGGISLGFPVGMSAGADEPEMAAPRVSVVASIGYCAFLAGPPLVGFLGDHLGVLRAITAVAVLLVVAILLAGNVHPPAATRS
jgi:fucose permease